MKKKNIFLILKILLSIILIYLIAKQVNMDNIKQAVLLWNPWFLVLGILIFILMQFFHVWRWEILLQKRLRSCPNFLSLLKFHFFGLFFQFFLPSSAGPDLVKAYKLSQHSNQKLESYTSVFFARLSGLILFLGVGLSLFIVAPQRFIILPGKIKILTVSIYLTMFAVLICIYNKKILKAVENMFSFALYQKLMEILIKMQNSLIAYQKEKKILLLTLLYTFGIFLCMIFSTFYIFKCFHIELSLVSLFSYMPLIYILTLIPITFNGAGIREYAFLLFFQKEGINNREIMLYFIGMNICLIVLSSMGGLTYFYEIFFKEKTQ